VLNGASDTPTGGNMSTGYGYNYLENNHCHSYGLAILEVTT